MGSNRRRDRARSRRNAPQAPASPTTSAAPRKARPAWRRQLDSFGGLTVLVPLVITIVAAIVLLARQPLGFAQSDDALMGDEVAITSAAHVPDGSITERPIQPPAGGPHYVVPQPVGEYEDVLDDGHVIHSLEHGIVWISYRPDAVSEEELDSLRRVYRDHSRDVILSPRPENDQPVYIVSWGRRMAVDASDRDTLGRFVETNRNRSPEPGIR